MMTVTAKKIEKDMQQLSLDEMLTLYGRLVVTIREKEDSLSLAPALREEIEKRVRDIDAGNVEGIDAFKALEGM